MTGLKPYFLASAAAASLMAGEAYAQPEGASGSQLEEVVVTARKQEENLQEVPISVTAFSGQALERQGATIVQDVVRFTPNARIKQASSDVTGMNLSFRGQIQNDVLSTLEPSVATYVDGFIWPRAYGSNTNLLDVQRVEILKGPQGTLFGRNTTGGALTIKTFDPDPGAASGRVSASYGNYNAVNLTGVFNVPLIEDTLAVRLALTKDSDHGWGRELVTGVRLFGHDSWNARLKLLWKPTDRLSLLLSSEVFDYDGEAPAPRLIYVNPALAGATDVRIASGGADNYTNYLAGDPYKVVIGYEPKVWTTTDTHVGNLSYDAGWARLTAIVGYRHFENRRIQSLDNVAYRVLDPQQHVHGHSYSQELQATGMTMSDRLRWTVGLFNFKEYIPKDFEASYALVDINPNAPARSDASVRNTSKAIYGQAVFEVTDKLNVTAGLRYSYDRRRMVSRNSSGPNFTCGVPVQARPDPAVCEGVFRRTDKGESYTFAINYTFADGVIGYAKTSKSFRGGGFQMRGSGSLAAFAPFAPETVKDYEVGLKSELFDRRVRLNLAGFYSDYLNKQESLVVAIPSGGIATIVSNAASAKIKGLEAELVAIVVEGLEVNASLGITDPEYKTFIDVTGDRSNEPFANVPKYTAAAGFQYTRPTEWGSYLLRADYSYTSKIVAPKNTRPPYTEMPAYGLVNARAAVTLDRYNVELALYGRNIFDKRYKYNLLDLNVSGIGIVTAYYGAPRQYGVQATVKF